MTTIKRLRHPAASLLALSLLAARSSAGCAGREVENYTRTHVAAPSAEN